MDGMVVDLFNGSTATCTSLIQWPMQNVTNGSVSSQMWIFDPDGTIRNILANKVIDIASNGENTVIWPKSGGGTQQWKLSDNYVSCLNASKVLDIYGGYSVAGTVIVAFQAHDGPNQKWKIVAP